MLPRAETVNRGGIPVVEITVTAPGAINVCPRLARGEVTVMELAKPFEMTQAAISQHLKVLEDAGLIVRRVDGAKRPRRAVFLLIRRSRGWGMMAMGIQARRRLGFALPFSAGEKPYYFSTAFAEKFMPLERQMASNLC